MICKIDVNVLSKEQWWRFCVFFNYRFCQSFLRALECTNKEIFSTFQSLLMAALFHEDDVIPTENVKVFWFPRVHCEYLFYLKQINKLIFALSWR